MLDKQAPASKCFLKPDPEDVSILPVITEPVMKNRARSNRQFQGNNSTPPS